MIVDVIIPSKTTEAHRPVLAECIRSLRLSEPHITFNVIVIESLLSDKIDVGQDQTIYFGPGKFSYNKALNMGIRASSAEWLVLANNDLLFHPCWFLEILKAHGDRLDVLSFTPWNSYYDWHQNRFPHADNLTIGYRTSYELGGWCIVVKRKVFDLIDLSERVSLWYSDNIYADELKKHGIPHGLVRKSKVDHLTSRTIDYHQYDPETDRLLYLEMT